MYAAIRALVCTPLLVALASAQAPGLMGRTLEFGRDIHPVLNARCANCHSQALRQGGLSVMTLDDLKKGGVSGAAIVPGSSGSSLLLDRITGKKQPVMPMGSAPLSEKEITLLREWVDRGASPGSGSGTPGWQAQMKPRKPSVPGEGHPVDAFLRAYWKDKAPGPTGNITDGAFARRVYFDLHGLPPTPEQLSAFLGDTSPGKRARLIETVFADRRRYAEHWISFWNDLLHNDEGVVYHGERKTISAWLLKALESNMPYDRFVAALLNPAGPGDPEGFVLGVNWRGDISASQTPAMQAAQNSAQVFLGVNIKCASCHDSFINSWKLKDAYGLASFFADEPLEIVRCDAKTGEKSAVSFLYPELGSVKSGGTVAERRAAAAALFVVPGNGRFTRTFVNRIWARLFGRGLVESLDDMDAQPWNADLLDWLASDFAEHKYDSEHLLRRLMTSAAYQLPAVKIKEEAAAQFVFRGPMQRRLAAEQFADAVSAITGQWRATLPSKPVPGELVRDWRLKASPLSRALGRPVRDLAVTDRAGDPSTLQALELVNGGTLATILERGGKYLAGELPPPPAPLFDSGVVSDRAATIDIDVAAVPELRLMLADHQSYDRTRVTAGWADAVFEGPNGTVKLADLLKKEGRWLEMPFKTGPARLTLVQGLDTTVTLPIAGRGFTRFRASAGVHRESVTSEVMPTVRFLVYAAEPDRWRMAKVANAPPVTPVRPMRTPREIVDYVFTYGFSRKPSKTETATALELVSGPGAKISASGVADLLWIVVLSPEFQFIL